MSDTEQTPGETGNIDPCKAVLDEARALGRQLAKELARPSAQDIARAIMEALNDIRVDVKAVLVDPRVQLLCQKHDVREKHLRDARKAIRTAQRQADRGQSGLVVPRRRRTSGKDVGASDGAASA